MSGCRCCGSGIQLPVSGSCCLEPGTRGLDDGPLGRLLYGGFTAEAPLWPVVEARAEVLARPWVRTVAGEVVCRPWARGLAAGMASPRPLVGAGAMGAASGVGAAAAAAAGAS